MLPDIDMIPNPDLDLQLESFFRGRQPANCSAVNMPSESIKTKNKNSKCAFVIPVYEISNDVKQLPETKADLLQLVSQKLSRPFHSALFSLNQKSSNLKRWEGLHQPENDNIDTNAIKHLPDVDVAYKVDKYQFKYEPLYVAKSDTPIFDERFIGFGLTRNTQVNI